MTKERGCEIKYQLIFSRLLLVISVILLLITISGHFQWVKYDNSPPTDQERLEEIPVHSIRDVLDYLNVKNPITEGKEQEVMIRFNDLINRRKYLWMID